MWENIIRHQVLLGDKVRREDGTTSQVVKAERTGPVGQDVTITYADGRVETADAEAGLWISFV